MWEVETVEGCRRELVVLDRQECAAAEPQILAQHLISAPFSPEVDSGPLWTS